MVKTMLTVRRSFTFSVFLFTTLFFAFCNSAAFLEEGAFKQNDVDAERVNAEARRDLEIDDAIPDDLPRETNDWAEDEDGDDEDDDGNEDTNDWAEDEDDNESEDEDEEDEDEVEDEDEDEDEANEGDSDEEDDGQDVADEEQNVMKEDEEEDEEDDGDSPEETAMELKDESSQDAEAKDLTGRLYNLFIHCLRLSF